jgi:hypothetical protein
MSIQYSLVQSNGERQPLEQFDIALVRAEVVLVFDLPHEPIHLIHRDLRTPSAHVMCVCMCECMHVFL